MRVLTAHLAGSRQTAIITANTNAMANTATNAHATANAVANAKASANHHICFFSPKTRASRT